MNYIKSEVEIKKTAFKLHSQKNMKEAMKYYQYFLDEGYNDPEVFCNYALILGSLGNIKQAIILYRKSIELYPNYHIAYYNLAIELYKKKNNLEAESLFKKLIQLKPDFIYSYINLAVLLISHSRLSEAEVYIRKAINIDPKYAKAHYILGNIQKKIGNSKDAIGSQLTAISLKNDYIEALTNLANLYHESGELILAEKYLKKIFSYKKYNEDTCLNLAIILKEMNKLLESENLIIKAINKYPYKLKLYYFLGILFRIQGKSDELTNYFNSALKLIPNDLILNLESRLIFAEIPFDNNQINRERLEYLNNIELLDKKDNLFYENNHSFTTNIFFLAYQNRYDDKLILTKLANMLSKKMGVINNSFIKDKQIEASKRRNKIRLGIFSDYLNDHSVALYYKNLLDDFASSDEIKLIIFMGPSAKINVKGLDYLKNTIELIILPESIKRSAEIILENSIDILFYLDIGMSNFSYLLSLSRLALVQLTSVGHPNTTGSPNIDYFLSSLYWENENSDEYYSEILIRLSRIPINYSKPKLLKSKYNFNNANISESTFLIGVTHSLFKFHPDFDNILDCILREIPNSILIFSEGKNKHITDKLKSRLHKTTNLVLKRSIFHPRVPFADFLAQVNTFDIMLDPFYFGMGNTFYQAVAFGTPVVTMPTNKLTSRGASTAYKQMHIIDPPIAHTPNEYISLCIKLYSDKRYRDDISNQIIKNSEKYLFNDKTIYKEYIQFFKDSLNAAQFNTYLTHEWRPNKFT